MNVIDATILPKVGFYGSTHRARKVTTAVCESEVAINQALHIGETLFFFYFLQEF
uniref:Uncharacterized protein n=1 Tax=Brassica oleracea TaxID=3712 RepID=A0A3P6GMF2_BRAOL|nr:unnamed protein product [Brassica oleracea]